MIESSSTQPCVHRFETDVSAIELPRQFTWPFHYVPHQLSRIAVGEVLSHVDAVAAWADELRRGKMLGVLVVALPDDSLAYLTAYSGTLAGRNNHRWFVPPVYDLLHPDGEYRRGEREITRLNHRIAELEQMPERAALAQERHQCVARQQHEVERMRAVMEQSRTQRHALREKGQLTAAEQQALLTESQHQRAELKRLRRRHASELAQLDGSLAALDSEMQALKVERRQRSEALQQRLFDLYILLNARGERQTLAQAFAEFALREHQPHRAVPPGGAGECCAPKLLQFAYLNHLRPLCMAEFWYGASPAGEVRHHGHYYPACRSKCLPILSFMLQGLDVEPNVLASKSLTDLVEVHDDRWLTVVVKPAGMLSEPGKLTADSALTRFKARHHEATGPVLVHRLDQETSGLLVFAKDKATHKELQRQFAEHEVRKEYVALLDGVVGIDGGIIDLPIRPNADDRPRQVVDYERGKRAVTSYQVLERLANGRTLVCFVPHTGRTHQLRVHASHPQGLGCPIVGDMLYGTADVRLMLHAARITIVHPATGQTLTVESPCPAEFGVT
ncbi:MAG: RNA pseudouridine synthase [Muribaculaceae bacterium]|nr:RNA pseudouridine synthase [Muribaculaceae bacterium]